MCIELLNVMNSTSIRKKLSTGIDYSPLRQELDTCFSEGKEFSHNGKSYGVLTQEVYDKFCALIVHRTNLDIYKANKRLGFPENLFNVISISQDVKLNLHEVAVWQISQLKKQGFEI